MTKTELMIHKELRDAARSSTGRRDPEAEGSSTFDQQSSRLRIASACRQRPRTVAELPGVSGQPPSNARTTAVTLVKYGVLQVQERGSADLLLQTDGRWHRALDAARRRSEVGHIDVDQRLLLVKPESASRFYELLADRHPTDGRLMWVGRIPDSDAYSVLAVLDPEATEDEVTRLVGELREASVEITSLRLGRRADFEGVRRLAMDSLPGAYLDEAI